MGPLLLGGYAFDPLSQKAPVWKRFPDGLLILPKIMVTATPRGAWLTLNSVVGETVDAGAEADSLYQAAQILETVILRAAGDGRRHGASASSAIELDEGDVAAWRRAVESAARIIRSGALEKAVLARMVRARLPRGISHGHVLDALMESYPECFTFGVRLGDRAFVGATPERLVALRGLDVETMSLAGSNGAQLPIPMRMRRWVKLSYPIPKTSGSTRSSSIPSGAASRISAPISRSQTGPRCSRCATCNTFGRPSRAGSNRPARCWIWSPAFTRRPR